MKISKMGCVTADVMLCEEDMAQCEGCTSAGIFIRTWLAIADMDEEKIMYTS